jgi:hypothetical protein
LRLDKHLVLRHPANDRAVLLSRSALGEGDALPLGGKVAWEHGATLLAIGHPASFGRVSALPKFAYTSAYMDRAQQKRACGELP